MRQLAILSFRSVNRADRPGYDPELQRHHLIPRAAIRHPSLARMVEDIGRARVGMDDFRRNGMLLPAREQAVLRTRLPLHRGPHGAYSAMVIERLGEIEGAWAAERARNRDTAALAALGALDAIRMKLRVQLLDRRRPLCLNRHDPIGADVTFTQLDALAELLWRGTG